MYDIEIYMTISNGLIKTIQLTVFNADCACITEIFIFEIIFFENRCWNDLKCLLSLIAKFSFKLVFGVNVSEPLNIIEYEPCQWYQHQNDEWDRDEKNWSPFLSMRACAIHTTCSPVPERTLFASKHVSKMRILICLNAQSHERRMFGACDVSCAMWCSLEAHVNFVAFVDSLNNFSSLPEKRKYGGDLIVILNY